MDKRLAEKLIADEHFMVFCNLVNLLRERGCGAGIPFDTALMLYDTKVDCLKGEENLRVIHEAVAEFLESGKVSAEVDFYDYMALQLGIV